MTTAAGIDFAAAEQRIRKYVRETPLERSHWLSDTTRAGVYLKLENMQETGAFKLRGAANKVLSLPRAVARPGIVAASNGNHAIAVATIGNLFGMATDVFVSEHIDPDRLARIQSLGVATHNVEGDCLAAELAARDVGRRTGRTYISPYNDPKVIEGQGTIGVELLRQLPSLEAVFVAVGGGGLISGIGTYLKAVAPRVEIVGCWPENAPALYESLQAGEVIRVPERDTLSVSTAGGVEPGSVTLDLARRCIDRSVLVSEEEILDALRGAYRCGGLLVEGAAGVALAGFRKVAAEYADRTVAIIVCGGNVDPGLMRQIGDDA